MVNRTQRSLENGSGVAEDGLRRRLLPCLLRLLRTTGTIRLPCSLFQPAGRGGQERQKPGRLRSDALARTLVDPRHFSTMEGSTSGLVLRAASDAVSVGVGVTCTGPTERVAQQTGGRRSRAGLARPRRTLLQQVSHHVRPMRRLPRLPFPVRRRSSRGPSP